MKIEIWSDVICPFCYIGKRNFEAALEQFADKKNIEVIWKSFQLDPAIPEVATESYTDYLVKRKGMAVEQVQGMLSNVTQMATQVGLDYHLDQSIIVNSLKAHQLIQFAKLKNLGSEAEERLFKAFFIEGKNIADTETLVQLGKDFGLDESEIKANLEDEKYKYEIAQDIQEAQNIGVTGVPFFVFDRKYAVSGAQPAEAFLETLNKSFVEWRKSNPEAILEITEGNSCTVDGKCD
ncbi:DsbA family oxidoreductase [Sphingobacterium psychroaquaticum]|uniref:DsbA family oxidoreductase n=1 Tax=Sphingobacterium psychroaquaticum TaxID=561061 RepID=UPI00106B9227|nr:DsbA family oxidoreductase [Sphingobacterium psychroaquaticum]QBQ41780.1 DsbA family oxidoreductase [Sphingobacterium psychroaquaticum]